MSSATIITCANCGKSEGESVNLKSCNACHMVKYCNRKCQVAHRPQHKKACKKRAAELYDEKFFKEVEREECPICLIPLINGNQTESFMACCGKSICIGCIYAMKMSEGKDLCAFCRTPPPSSDEEQVKRLYKLMDKGNANAFDTLGACYFSGTHGLPQDRQRANELYQKAGELGCANSYYNLGNSYLNGRGIEVDMKKAIYYWELAAIMGNLQARVNVGSAEGKAGNHHRGMKHYIIAAKAGDEETLEGVKKGFLAGLVTKDEYASTLRAYQKIQDEMKSDAREKAEASGMFR